MHTHALKEHGAHLDSVSTSHVAHALGGGGVGTSEDGARGDEADRGRGMSKVAT